SCSRVDLPEPLRPMMPTASPRRMSRLTPDSAWNSLAGRARGQTICSICWYGCSKDGKALPTPRTLIATSEDIGKPPAGQPEPRIGKVHRHQPTDGVRGQAPPVRKYLPQRHVARLVDEECQRIEMEHEAVLLRHRIQRDDCRGQEEHAGDHDRY